MVRKLSAVANGEAVANKKAAAKLLPQPKMYKYVSTTYASKQSMRIKISLKLRLARYDQSL